MSTPVLENIENFGDRVRATRKALGFSQPILANKLGVSNGAVGNWETGPSIPQPDTLRKLAAILEVSVEWLLNGDMAHSRGNSQNKDESPSSPRQKIRDHIEKFMATCDESELSWLLVEVRQKFPLDKFRHQEAANSTSISIEEAAQGVFDPALVEAAKLQQRRGAGVPTFQIPGPAPGALTNPNPRTELPKKAPK